MASPQLEDGYTRIANELLEELCRFPMGGPHFRIAIWILRFTYGWEGRKEMRLNMADVGRGIGMDKGNVRRAVLELQQMRVVNVQGKTIGLNKDWESWRLQNEVKVTTNEGNKEVELTTEKKSDGPPKRSQADPLYKERKDIKDISPNTPLKSKTKKATAVPIEFEISEINHSWLLGEFGKIPLETIEFQRDQFIDFFTGSGKPKKNWDATWRNWMRNWWRQYGGKKEVESKNTGLTLEQATKESYERRHGQQSDG